MSTQALQLGGMEKIRDNPESLKQPQPAAAAPTTGPRAAACTTVIYYDEFPSEDERFQCSAGLGALTREQILEKGWKVDFGREDPAAFEPTGAVPARLAAISVQAGDLALRRVEAGLSSVPVTLEPTARDEDVLRPERNFWR